VIIQKSLIHVGGAFLGIRTMLCAGVEMAGFDSTCDRTGGGGMPAVQGNLAMRQFALM